MNKETGGPAFPVSHDMALVAGLQNAYGMTLRQYAAIKLKVPDSGTDWLDGMITKSLKDYFAAKAMQGVLACPIQPQSGADMYARDAYAMADAMLKAREQ